MTNETGFQTSIQGPDAGQPGSTRNLLIIEDAVIHSTIISRIAEQVGFSTTTAKSYDDAASLLRQRSFDCVTVDLGLGEHAGSEVFRLLAAAASRVPTVIISGAESDVCEATARFGKSLGLNICEPIRKPVDLVALREALGKIIKELRLERLAATGH